MYSDWLGDDLLVLDPSVALAAILDPFLAGLLTFCECQLPADDYVYNYTSVGVLN